MRQARRKYAKKRDKSDAAACFSFSIDNRNVRCKLRAFFLEGADQ